MRTRRAVSTLSAVAVVAALSGCTVPPVGSAGVGVDEQGNPLGYLVICEKHVDGATLWHQKAGTVGGAGEVSDGSWNASEPVTRLATWTLTEPTHGWSTKEPLGPLEPGVTYSLYGWTKDSTSSAISVDFTTADLALMTPGQVRFPKYDQTAKTWGTATGTVKQFQSTCDDWGK